MYRKKQLTAYSERGFWLRFRNRLEHGLAMQEILDRLARAGIVIYPYFLVYSPIVTSPKIDPLNKDVYIKSIDAEEIALIASVPERQPRGLGTRQAN